MKKANFEANSSRNFYNNNSSSVANIKKDKNKDSHLQNPSLINHNHDFAASSSRVMTSHK